MHISINKVDKTPLIHALIHVPGLQPCSSRSMMRPISEMVLRNGVSVVISASAMAANASGSTEAPARKACSQRSTAGCPWSRIWR